MSTPSKPLPQGPVLEAQTQRFLDALAAQGGPPIYQLSYADARQVLENAQAGVSGLPADTEDRVLPTGPTGEVAVRIPCRCHSFIYLKHMHLGPRQGLG